MVDWNLVAKIAGGGFGVTILVLIVLALVAWIVGLVVQKMGQEANSRNFLLMHAMGPNMAGAISTSVVAGIFLGMLM